MTTGGSDLPDGAAGSRDIPDVECAAATAEEFWSTSELWKADQTIVGADGEPLVRYDPWFGVRNPSRKANGANPVDAVSLDGTLRRRDRAIREQHLDRGRPRNVAERLRLLDRLRRRQRRARLELLGACVTTHEAHR